MILVKRDRARQSDRESRRVQTNACAIPTRTKYEASPRHSVEPLQGMASRVNCAVASCARRFRWPAKEIRMLQRQSLEFLSSPKVRLSDALKTLAARHDRATLGESGRGWNSHQISAGRERLSGAGAAFGSNAILAARPRWPEPLREPLTPAARCSTRIVSCSTAHDSSAKTFFVTLASHQALETAARGNAEVNQARSNSVRQSDCRPLNPFCNARNVPVSEARQTHLARPGRDEMAIAFQDLRDLETRTSSRMKNPGQVCRPRTAQDDQRHARGRGERILVQRVQERSFDQARSLFQSLDALQKSNARGECRFHIRRVPRRSQEIRCGGWRCDCD
jgi:hypothetical protein